MAALAFQVIFRNEPVPAGFEAREPFPVRDFIGCANLVNREIFLALGGYEERFEFFTEETEFGLRAIQEGYEIHAYPAVVIRHHLAPSGRNRVRRGRQFIRNEMLVALWFFPFPDGCLRAARALPGILIKNPEWRKYGLSLVAGYLEAPIRWLTWPKQKKRLTHPEFEAWRKMPMAVSVVMGTKQP